MAVNKSESIQVTGINQFVTALKQMDEQLPDAMTGHLLGLAEMIAGNVRSAFPHLTGNAAGSVRAKATAKGASITEGGAAARYVPWLDFGGSVGRGHKLGPNMGAVHRTWMGKPAGKGRFLFPQISAAKAETFEALEGALEEVAREAGFTVSRD